MDQDLLNIWERTGPIRVKNLNEFIESINKFVEPRIKPFLEVNRFLFRGTSNSSYDLLPSLPRLVDKNNPRRSWITRETLYDIEDQSTNQFKIKARLYIDAKFLPADNDILAWWQLMQHHYAKTRLLDWSASPYVAAYFAVVENPMTDGAIWMIDHGAHSGRMEERYPEQYKSAKGRKLHIIGSLPKMRIPGDPAPDVVANILAESNKNSDINYAYLNKEYSDSLYFIPFTIPNQRMCAQQGWFSCASVIDADHGEAIAKAFSDPKHSDRWWCQRIIIDSSAKSNILRGLLKMNITGETIYQGLDGLGRAMGEMVDLLTPDKLVYRFDDGLLSARRDHNDPEVCNSNAPNPLTISTGNVCELHPSIVRPMIVDEKPENN